jgi:hypothetical protein
MSVANIQKDSLSETFINCRNAEIDVDFSTNNTNTGMHY